MVHLGQIGLGSLLCEVLIHLNGAEESGKEQDLHGGTAFVVEEELALTLPQELIGEVLGNSILHGFLTLRPAYKPGLFVEYWTKGSLIFVGADGGGERILSASGVVAESMELPLLAVPAFLPGALKLKKIISRHVLINSGKALLRNRFITSFSEEEPSPAIAPLKSTGEEKKVEPVMKTVAPPVRPRPGQKWMKKNEESQTLLKSPRKVLAIKFSA
jgi:hypothetical protein